MGESVRDSTTPGRRDAGAPRPPILAVDFDGTICEDRFPEIGPPREHVIAALRELKAAGWRVIIHTCRTNRALSDDDSDPAWGMPHDRDQRVCEMLGWLREHNVPIDGVWGLFFAAGGETIFDCMHMVDESAVGKPFADVYWDDRAVCLDPDIADRTAPLRANVDELIAATELLVRWAPADAIGDPWASPFAPSTSLGTGKASGDKSPQDDKSGGQG